MKDLKRQPKCLVCGKKVAATIWPNRDRKTYRKYCSESCRGKFFFKRHHAYYQKYWLTRPWLGKWKKKKKCPVCQKFFMPTKGGQVNCSSRCTKKKWKKANWDKVLADQRAWFKRSRAKNPEYFRWFVKQRNHQKRGTDDGTFTREEWEKMKRQYGFRCAKCNKKRKLTIDHIKPLSKGGTHSLLNIQPLCKNCNSKKHDKLLPAFRRRD